LITDQLLAHGVKKTDISIGKKIIKKVIEEYTFEYGMRTLGKMVAIIVRNRARQIAMEESFDKTISQDDLFKILSPSRSKTKYGNNEVAGIVTGLAWTSMGGDILFIESSLAKGKGNLTLTGNLGDVMKESAVIALQYLRAHAEWLDLKPEVFNSYDVHVHVPEGATPKDGPSAGITRSEESRVGK